jgi:hypothetical protein
MDMELNGLPKGSRIAPTVLGHRGSRLVVHVPVKSKVDERTGLPFCAVKSVFHDDNSVFIGFGVPNVFTMLPSKEEGKWDKFSAFMFFRKRSYVAKKIDRMQAGVYFDLRGLPSEATDAIRREMKVQEGRLTASCANANARVLSAAGFTCGGKSLKRVYRPSHLAALIWEHGLEYKGEKVSIRILLAGREVSDHFQAVWMKEFTSFCRMVEKTVKEKLVRNSHAAVSAPKFLTNQRVDGMSVERWTAAGELATVGISRPSWFGVWLGFILGQRPIFSAEPGMQITAPELQTALPAFPGKLDKVTKLKRYILFSRPVVWAIRRHLVRDIDQYKDVPRQAIVEMLRLSNGPTHEQAFVYNLVVTGSGIHIARLENRNGRDRKIINWLMAKHVLISGYDHDVRFAGEIWIYVVDGEYTVYLSPNSGTYRPGDERLKAIAAYLRDVFHVKVEIVPVS